MILMPGNPGQESGPAGPSHRAAPGEYLDAYIAVVGAATIPSTSKHCPAGGWITCAGQAIDYGMKPGRVFATEVADGGICGIDPDRVWVILIVGFTNERHGE